MLKSRVFFSKEDYLVSGFKNILKNLKPINFNVNSKFLDRLS